MAEILTKKQALLTLQKGELTVQNQVMVGSNYTFFGTVTLESIKFPVVYKPTRGEQPLWDFPTGTLSRREVAAFLVGEALGWDLVPPTVYRRKGPLGAGSLQVFIEHNPEYHYFSLRDDHRQRLRPVALFDCIINNADRKGGHVLFDADDHLWLIDHGICFHVEDKLRTVIWDFAGEPIPPEYLEAMTDFAVLLANHQGDLFKLLRGLISSGEIKAMASRTNLLLKSGVFPQPTPNRRPYPWPPI